MGGVFTICCPAGADDSRGRFPSNVNASGLMQARGTLAPNMKNFKNLRYVDDIKTIYVFGKELGKGSFGSVNKCVRKSTQ